MEKNNLKKSLFILAILIISSFSFFVIAQEKNNTQNIFLDSDQDGLSDAEEKAYGTDPFKADTDGDGYSDGVEVQGGYDPLKPAPGDKIIPSEKTAEQQKALDQINSDKNLTKLVAQKISAKVDSSDPSQQQFTLSDVQKIVSDSVASEVPKDTLPEIKKEDIKIKKQDYKKLSEEERKNKLKEDATDYAIALFYIFSSNSPTPITSSNDLTQVKNSFFQEINSAMLTRDSSKLEAISTSGEKITAQMKDMEVPEDLVDLHMKILQFLQYSIDLKKYFNPTQGDPLADVVNISKIENFINSMTSFIDEMQTKFTEYGITYDENIQKKLKDLGIDPSMLNSVSQLLNASGISTSTSSSTDSTTTTPTLPLSDILNSVD